MIGKFLFFIFLQKFLEIKNINISIDHIARYNMPLYEINGRKPIIGKGTWIAPSAEIIGDVRIGNNCYIAFGAVLRGDFGTIIIGDESSVEDNVVIHCAKKAEIGRRVIIGHMVMVHDCHIEDNTLIGMQSMICDNSVIKEWSIIAEQSMVKKNQVIPTGKIYGGSPAVEIGSMEKRHRDGLVFGQKAYLDLTAKYIETFNLLE